VEINSLQQQQNSLQQQNNDLQNLVNIGKAMLPTMLKRLPAISWFAKAG